MLRQQHPATDGFCYSLADFVAPENDYVGAFATTIQRRIRAYAEEHLKKTMTCTFPFWQKQYGRRLAEAAAEWLH